MSAYQGLRPWLRSLALRAKTELVFIVYQGLRPWQHSLALRAGIDVVQCPPTRDFVPGYVRSPSGRRQKLVFIVYQGLRPWRHSLASG